MVIEYETMQPWHYEQVIKLWQNTEGVGLGSGDSEEGFYTFLERNPGLSFIALSEGEVIGTILCGHDARRGYLYHLAVETNFRRQGIGCTLIERGLTALKSCGILKCHLFVFENNATARDFWNSNGWKERDDLVIMSRNI